MSDPTPITLGEFDYVISDGGTRNAYGFVVGLFGVNERYGTDDQPRWRITHLPTGYSIPCEAIDVLTVLRIVQLLNADDLWNFASVADAPSSADMKASRDRAYDAVAIEDAL